MKYFVNGKRISEKKAFKINKINKIAFDEFEKTKDIRALRNCKFVVMIKEK